MKTAKDNVIYLSQKIKERKEKAEAESRKRSIDRILRRTDKLTF